MTPTAISCSIKLPYKCYFLLKIFCVSFPYFSFSHISGAWITRLLYIKVLLSIYIFQLLVCLEEYLGGVVYLFNTQLNLQWYLWWDHTPYRWTRLHIFTRCSNFQGNAKWRWWGCLVNAGEYLKLSPLISLFSFY